MRLFHCCPRMNDQFQQHVYVNHLLGIVADAWSRCIWDYFQLVTLRLVDPHYAQRYIESCLKDFVEFNNLTRQLKSTELRNKQVWRAWDYIRELVIKYQTIDDIRIATLDHGAKENTRFKWEQFLVGSHKKPTILMERPIRRVTLEEWNKFQQSSLNSLLDEATEMCGREVENRENWNYNDIFGNESPRLKVIFA